MLQGDRFFSDLIFFLQMLSVDGMCSLVRLGYILYLKMTITRDGFDFSAVESTNMCNHLTFFFSFVEIQNHTLDEMTTALDDLITHLLSAPERKILLLTVPPIPKYAGDETHKARLKKFNLFIKGYAYGDGESKSTLHGVHNCIFLLSFSKFRRQAETSLSKGYEPAIGPAQPQALQLPNSIAAKHCQQV